MKFDRMYKRDMPEIPPLENSTSVLLALGQVVRALNYETMDCKRAGLMLYGLQIAATVAARIKEPNHADCVRSIHNLEGEPIEFAQVFGTGAPMLAPENSVCEPPHDCENCPQHNACEKRRAALPSAPDQVPDKPAPGSEEAGRRVRNALYDHMLQQSKAHPEEFEPPRYSREEFHNYFTVQAAAEDPADSSPPSQDRG